MVMSCLVISRRCLVMEAEKTSLMGAQLWLSTLKNQIHKWGKKETFKIQCSLQSKQCTPLAVSHSTCKGLHLV